MSTFVFEVLPYHIVLNLAPLGAFLLFLFSAWLSWGLGSSSKTVLGPTDVGIKFF